MAETKTARSATKSGSGRSSPNGARAKSSSRGSTKSASRGRSNGRKTTGSRARSASGSKRSGASGSKRSSASSGSPKPGTESPVAKAVGRAKGPAIAGGAALVGLAGGLALQNGKKRTGLGAIRPKLNLSLPKGKGSTVKVLGGAAKEIAKGGYKIGQLTSEVQKVRKAVEASDSGK
jgi:hypothetical protein